MPEKERGQMDTEWTFGYRPAQSRKDLCERTIKKHGLRKGRCLTIMVRNRDNEGRKEPRMGKIIFMNAYFITLEDLFHSTIKYTLYYFDLENHLAKSNYG